MGSLPMVGESLDSEMTVDVLMVAEFPDEKIVPLTAVESPAALETLMIVESSEVVDMLMVVEPSEVVDVLLAPSGLSGCCTVMAEGDEN